METKKELDQKYTKDIKSKFLFIKTKKKEFKILKKIVKNSKSL